MHQINLELQSAIAAIQKRNDQLKQHDAEIQKTYIARLDQLQSDNAAIKKSDAARFDQLQAEIQALLRNQGKNS